MGGVSAVVIILVDGDVYGFNSGGRGGVGGSVVVLEEAWWWWRKVEAQMHFNHV